MFLNLIIQSKCCYYHFLASTRARHHICYYFPHGLNHLGAYKPLIPSIPLLCLPLVLMDSLKKSLTHNADRQEKSLRIIKDTLRMRLFLYSHDESLKHSPSRYSQIRSHWWKCCAFLSANHLLKMQQPTQLWGSPWRWKQLSHHLTTSHFFSMTRGLA